MTQIEATPPRVASSAAEPVTPGPRIFELWDYPHERRGPVQGARPRILLLADDQHPSNTIRDNIAALIAQRDIEFMVWNPRVAPNLGAEFRDLFDAIVIHYSIFVFDTDWLPASVSEFVAEFPGLKIQFVQDEYRRIRELVDASVALGVHVLVSVLRSEHIRTVYADPRLDSVLKFSCLPGYAPEAISSADTLPLSARRYDVSYRTRPQAYWLGRLAQEKVILGDEFKRRAKRTDLVTNIETSENKRLYGDKWNGLLSDSKAVLAAPGGASIFDFDGTLQSSVERMLAARPDADFETVWQQHLREAEGNLVHEQLTPRVFEAIAARTALIMFPSDYRGLLQPWQHYLPLERDFSNFDEIVSRLGEPEGLQVMVDHCYRDIIVERKLTSPEFATRFARLIRNFLDDASSIGDARVGRWSRRERAAHADGTRAQCRREYAAQKHSWTRRVRVHVKQPAVGIFLRLSRILPGTVRGSWIRLCRSLYGRVAERITRAGKYKN